MAKTKKTCIRYIVRKGFDAATASLLLFPLLLSSLPRNELIGLREVEAFVTPSGKSHATRPLNVLKKDNTFLLHPRNSLHLRSVQQHQEQQQLEDPNDIDDKDEAKRLLLDAERLRLEAEQLDTTLTLQKIAVLEEKLSNDAWLKKQQGQTVKDLYEQLRQLETKVNQPTSSIRNMDEIKLAVESSEAVESPTPAISSEEKKDADFSDRYKSNNEQTNPNLPPIAGFDDKDLKIYIPVAEDVTRMAPNATLDERIKLFRDAPELQAHFKEKIENLLLGPLEEMQELETLKQQFFDSTSSREKDALLKQIKKLEAKMDENDIGVSTNTGGGTIDSGEIGYSSSILISPEKLPPLTESELKERYETIKALPDILVAVYLQRNGLYDLPSELSTINFKVGNGGIGVNITNDKGKNDDDESEHSTNSNNDEGDDSFDLYGKLKLGIQLDYYDLQLQLLNQGLAIRPMPDDVRKDYAAAFKSLPVPVRERYVTDTLGINTIETGIISSDEDKDVERVLDEILKPMDDNFPFLNLSSNKKSTEQPIVPLEYNDVEFIDRSRYLEEFFPSVPFLEDMRPSAEDVDLFVTDCLTGQGNKLFNPTSKPERVMGGWYVRGSNLERSNEDDSTTANDKLIQEVQQRLQNHPTLNDKLEFYYILDPSPPSEEDMELDITPAPLLLITGKDSETMYGLSKPLTKAAITISGLVSTFLFSVGSCVLNPQINAGIEKSIDGIQSMTPTAEFIDITWFFDLCLPMYFSFLGILFAHELGHRIVATYYKFDIGVPNVIPSITTGLAGSITPIKSPPPNNKALFDFAIAGPLAGLFVSLGLLLVGLEMTRQMGIDANLPVIPVDLARVSSLGGGMIQYFLGKYSLLPGQGPGANVELHPFAISGWIGCVINALALLPLGHTDGGRISLAMFGRRGAFVVKLFTTLLLVLAGLFGVDDMNVLLAYAIFALLWQRELESPIRNEVDEIDFSRGLLGITSALLVGLILIPMTS